jgi:hypothetical protein
VIRRKRLWATGIFLGVLAIFMIGLLVGKPMSRDRQAALCVVNINLPGPFRLLLQCDAIEFLRLGYQPSGLFEEGNPRQSRPGLIVAAYLVAKFWQPLASVVQPFVMSSQGDTWRNAQKVEFGLQHYLATFIAYVSLNVIFLTISFALYILCVKEVACFSADSNPALLFPGILLVFNNVVKEFVWSPHTQILNILASALGLYFVFYLSRKPPLAPPRLYFYALLTGIGVLAYPSAFILIPCLFAGQIMATRRASTPLATLRSFLKATIVILAALAPLFCWHVLVLKVVGSYTLLEVSRYDNVIWLYNALQQGAGVFAAKLFAKLWFFIRSAAIQTVPAAAIILLAGSLVAFKGERFLEWWKWIAPLATAAILVSGICVAFFTVIGWESDRLAFAAVPPIIALSGTAACRAGQHLSDRWGRLAVGGAAIIVLAQGLYTLLRDGPYS